MKIVRAYATNFQSYPELDFNFSDTGLVLISGPTGSGKSTLMDVIPWVLYGITSKDGAVDDIRRWGCDETTVGSVIIELNSGYCVEIVRIRGKPSENDLYYIQLGTALVPQHPSDPIRGKDINETQTLIEDLLGVSPELFLMGSYMDQFSKADSFFIAKAKERRQVLEQIAEQRFAIILGEKAAAAKKETKKQVSDLQAKINTLSGKRDAIKEQIVSSKASKIKWTRDREEKISLLTKQRDSFVEETKQKIKTLEHEQFLLLENIQDTNKSDHLLKETESILQQVLENKDKKIQVLIEDLSKLKLNLETLTKAAKHQDACPTCKRKWDNSLTEEQLDSIGLEITQVKELIEEKASELKKARAPTEDEIECQYSIKTLKAEQQAQKELQAKITSITNKIELLKENKNPYITLVEEAKTETNPFIAEIQALEAKYIDTELEEGLLRVNYIELNRKLASLEWIYDKSFELRGIMMNATLTQVQDQSNYYLEKFFDAALRIQLIPADSDKIDVLIMKDGHEAPFKQLSGGERCMLKLAFSLSLMKAAQNKAGVSFNVIMLDEAMNGLSDELKIKAFGLLQDLEKDYSSVLCIDHCVELKHYFNKVITVTKTGGHSELNE